MRSRLTGLAGIGVLAAAAVGISAPNVLEGIESLGADRLSSNRRSLHKGKSIAQANRWTGKPHEHKREIARRLRQAASL
jgi:hypothetical protein